MNGNVATMVFEKEFEKGSVHTFESAEQFKVANGTVGNANMDKR